MFLGTSDYIQMRLFECIYVTEKYIDLVIQHSTPDTIIVLLITLVRNYTELRVINCGLK